MWEEESNWRPFLVQNGRVCGVGDRYNYVHKLHITRFSLFYQFNSIYVDCT